MPTALALSPHLDDAVFSCGGVLAGLADEGWHVCMATAFTRSIHPASGFALACQLDKGLSPEVDYMALRRAEDRDAAAILGIADVRHLDLPEAPHRGYDTAAALFGATREGDETWRTLAGLVADLVGALPPDIVFAPQGLGGHVDHRQAIRAVLAVMPAERVAWYRDTPYAIRAPDAAPDPALPPLPAVIVPLPSEQIERKIAASCAYRSQVGFQFGGRDAAAAALRRFAEREGHGVAAECFLGRVGFPTSPGLSHSAATI